MKRERKHGCTQVAARMVEAEALLQAHGAALAGNSKGTSERRD